MRASAMLLVFAFAAACGHAADAPPPSTTTPPPPSSVACERGAPCSPDGATCMPETLGTGWAHGFACVGGTWQDLEIAPMPVTTTPPPPS